MRAFNAALLAAGTILAMALSACQRVNGLAASKSSPAVASQTCRGAEATQRSTNQDVSLPVAAELSTGATFAALKPVLASSFASAVASLAPTAGLDAEVVARTATPELVSAWHVGPTSVVALVGVSGGVCWACGMQAFEASLAQKDGVWGLVAVRYLGELGLLGSFSNPPKTVEFRQTSCHRAWFLTGGYSRQGISHTNMEVYLADHTALRFERVLAVEIAADNAGADEVAEDENAYVAWTNSVTIEPDLGVTLLFKDLTEKASAEAATPIAIGFDAAKPGYNLTLLPPALRMMTGPGFGASGMLVPTHPRFAM